MKRLWYILIILSLILAACGGDDSDESKDESASGDQAADNTSDSYTGRKVVWVDSYHEGYAWSDDIQAGIESVLNGTGVEFKIVRLDTKHVLDDAGRKAAAEQVRAEIDAFAPDVIIASDDDAQSYLIVPYYKNTATPVLFIGVNNDPSPYGYPASNVTGMVEVDLAERAVEQMREHMKGSRIGFLSDDTTTSYRMAESYEKRIAGLEITQFTNSYEEFKRFYLEMQSQVDLLIIHGNSGIADWDAEDAKKFVVENTSIPTVGVLDFMSPYLLVDFALVADEEGAWAGETALKILSGTPVSEIPMVTSQQGKVYVNLDIAAALELTFSPSLLRDAIVVESQPVESSN